jgi:DNA mismatch endonuclease (patch repair protein)
MMAGIRGKNTKPEILIRKGLHAKNLPGKPDMVFPKYSAVIFVNGCFWHGHDCHLFRIPKSNVDFWQSKISRNKELDVLHTGQLLSMGWRVGMVWECALKGKSRVNFDVLLGLIEVWLHSSDSQLIY